MKTKIRCQDEKLNQYWRENIIEKSENPISDLHVGQCLELFVAPGFNTNAVYEIRGFVDGQIVVRSLKGKKRYTIEHPYFFEAVLNKLSEIPTKKEALKRAKQFEDEAEG